MSLQAEIEQKRAQTSTDAYSMSIGELVNLYESKEIDIHPDFQRFFRWTPSQKTKLIESLLLGIPLPPIFVAQRTDGVWEVVDGVQRLSTIFQFMGILRDENGVLREPLVLGGTKYLPSLQGKRWNAPGDAENSFTPPQRLYLKRAKIDVNIVLKESDDASKYELFQRLNMGGSPLLPQEGRNCIMVMVDKEKYTWMRQLSDDENFKECVVLSERDLEEQYDMELVLRFLILRNIPEDRLQGIGDIGEFLTDKLMDFLQSADVPLDSEATCFRTTFRLINEGMGSDAFRRFDWRKTRFAGGFLVSAFEVVACGLGYHCEALERLTQRINLEERVKELWRNEHFLDEVISTGVHAHSRIPKSIPLGRSLFGP